MKAVVYDRYGAPEVMRLNELPRPEPNADEVLVRIRAVEATKGDCELRSMRFPVKWFAWALRLGWGVGRPRRSRRVLGGYFAGEVASVGAAVTRFEPGDRVFGCAKLRMGAYAEYAVYPESYAIAKLPTGVDYVPAAAALLGGLNALHFLNLGKLTAGDHLLIIGAGGSIGLLAIQIAKARGATVTAVDRTAKAALIRRAGADHFVDFTKTAPGADGQRFDVVFSMPVAVGLAEVLALAKPRGRVLLGNPRLADLLRVGLGKPTDGKTAHAAFAGETQAELETLAAMLGEGTLAPIIDRTLGLAEAPTAHRLVETETRLGAVVLVP